MELTEQKIQQMIENALDKRANTNQYGVSKIPYHTHNGTDSIRIDFKNLIGVPCYEVADSTVAPTIVVPNGTIIFQYDASHWNLWVRINNLWKTEALS